MVRTPDITIIIVSWNVKDLLYDCLKSIETTSAGLELEVFVVDNNSSDGSPLMVQDHFPSVQLEVLPENIGFAAANNVALRMKTAPFVLLLNPDTRLLPDSIQALLRYLEKNPEMGAVGPQLLNGQGKIDPSCRRFPTLGAAFHQFTVAKYLSLFRVAHRHYMMADFDHLSETSVDQIMGACMLVRKEVLSRVGFLDETFFIYYEEVDWCYRMKKAGYSIGFTPTAKIIHFSDQSTMQVWDKMFFHKVKSLLYYFSKTKPPLLVKMIKPWFKLGVLLKLILNRVEYSTKSKFYNLKAQPSPGLNKGSGYQFQAQQTKLFLKNYFKPLLYL
ncbi:glycosyltransferase family 2 protein [candidate division CSSED10-310 bacterium]|uniref:Glycosyltransferase family 2 protein n=1 Tax=candidate division CSSED10-310 bacterium TaxID=2855610 RepID=A0ABV6Z5Z8_UNCC1